MFDKQVMQKLGEALKRLEQGALELTIKVRELKEGQRELKTEIKELKEEISGFKKWQREMDEWKNGFSKEVKLVAGFIEIKNRIRSKSVKPKLTFRRPYVKKYSISRNVYDY